MKVEHSKSHIPCLIQVRPSLSQLLFLKVNREGDMDLLFSIMKTKHHTLICFRNALTSITMRKQIDSCNNYETEE